MPIRPMQASDLPTIAELDRLCYPFPWTLNNFADSMRAGYRCCVLEELHHIRAYAILMAVLDEIHLLNLTVAPPWQGLGYGQAMLNRLIMCAKAEGYSTMWLEVRPSNEAACHIYHTHAFAQVGVRKNYYPAQQGREDAYILVRDLTC